VSVGGDDDACWRWDMPSVWVFMTIHGRRPGLTVRVHDRATWHDGVDVDKIFDGL
jgi:hypothetical protein